MKRRSSLHPQKRFRPNALGRGMAIPVLGGGFSGAGLVAIALLLLTISVFNPAGLSGVRMGVTDALAPVLSAVVKPVTQAADIVRNVSGLGELQAENIRLQQENLKLKEWYQTALLLESENKSLRDLLNVKLEPHYKTVSARVLGDSGNAFVKSILVSAGTKDGVQKNQAVLSGEGVIGRIIDSGLNTARILLINDINSRVPVLIEDTRQHAILAGDNTNALELLHLPPDSELKDGARIITSGHGGLFPPGLAIGRVQKNEQGHAIVKPFVDFGRIVHVRVVDSSNNPNLVAGSQHLN